jgi:hypothetical protein
MADAVYCAGVDLRTYLTPMSLVKMYGIPPAVGQDYQIPGYVGALPAQLGRGPRNVSVGGLILGWDPAVSPMPQENVEEAREQYHANLANFSTAVFQGGEPFALTWITGPTGAEVTRVATARYEGGVDEIEQLLPYAGRVVVDFLLLTPFWQ